MLFVQLCENYTNRLTIFCAILMYEKIENYRVIAAKLQHNDKKPLTAIKRQGSINYSSGISGSMSE